MTAASNARKMPVVFLSHGAPTVAIQDGAAHRFLREFGGRLPTPRAILVLSAHFVAPSVTITAANDPDTIHDFGGFPDELYRIRYRAPGDPGLAARVAELLSAGDVPARLDTTRGIDHGAWIPLQLMYPEENVPVVQLSLDPGRGTGYHYRLGELLAPLRDDEVLIMGSGGVTHNLGELQWHGATGSPPPWAESFNEWVASAIADARFEDLLAYRDRGPGAARNHPTEEHFLPLLCALGAVSNADRRSRVHHSYTYGALSMDAYEFGGKN